MEKLFRLQNFTLYVKKHYKSYRQQHFLFTIFQSVKERPGLMPSPNKKQQIIYQKDRVALLHSMLIPEMLDSNDQKNKPLLLHAAFHNSPVSALYLLRRGAKLTNCDSQGKTVFHICAYTGHVQVLKIIRNEMKLSRIRQLNEKYIQLLNKNNYKRTDTKKGKLKISASQARKKIFQNMQAVITGLYEKYVNILVFDTFNSFTSVVKSNNRNCFHLACLNRYQRCTNILEYMFEQLGDIYLHLDSPTLQNYNQVNSCFHTQNQKIDPRQYEDTLQLIQQTILPYKLQQIKKNLSSKIEEYIQKILETKDYENHTPLYIASKDGCTAIINLIKKLQSPKDKKSDQKEQIIKIASHNLARSHIMDLCDASKEADSKTMNFLLSCGEDINKKKTIFGTFALLQAIKSFETQRNMQPIRLLILSGADVNQQDTNGWTIFHHACQRGLIAIIAEVFKIWQEGKTKKILINRFTNKNYHCLHLAAMNNHPELIQFLLTNSTAKKLQINLSSVDGDRCTMLHHASRKGSVQALKKILDLAPQLIYQPDIRSNTALHYAAMGDHSSCIKYLLYFDSDFDKLQSLKNTRGKLAKDLTVNKKPFENIFLAARQGDVSQVRKMIAQTPQLKKITTPIKQPVLNQHLLVVKYLVQQGANVSHKDKCEKTVRQYAIQMQVISKGKQEQVVAKNILTLLSE